MNKEEIEAKLDEMTKRRMEISDNILWLKEQLAEAEKLEKLDKLLEKPKPRHGDFGYNNLGYPRLILQSENNKELFDAGILYCDAISDDYTPPLPDPILGNVFDLMKDWDKPFEDFEIKPIFGGREIRITKSSMKDIWICIIETTDSMKRKGAHLTLAESEEFHKALGHAIAELKQKKEIKK